MALFVRYLKSPPEGYKVTEIRKEGNVTKYKMKSVKRLPSEHPNEAVIQSVTKRFMTQRGSEPVYSQNYGVDWDKFVGNDITADLALSIEREIKESLSVCKFVEKVEVKIGALSSDKLVVNCKVTVDGKYTVSGKSEIVTVGRHL